MSKYVIEMPGDVHHLLEECHAAAARSGWWTDLEAGEPIARNKGELLCLVHSEISEAYEALKLEAMDDKLPHRKGVEVELADAFIRIGDYAGGHGYVLTLSLLDPLFSMRDFPDLGLSELHSLTSAVMEDERKSRSTAPYQLSRLMHAVIAYAQLLELDLFGAVREKLAYNAQRADHKIENRRQAGGKAW